MKIDICELMNRRADRINFSYDFDPRHTDVECVLMPEDVVIPDGGIHVEGSVTDILGCMTFRADIKVKYTTACARCLDEVEGNVELRIERMILTDGAGGGELEPDYDSDGEWNGVLEDVLYVNEARIIPDADIMEEISLELPPFTLCSPDCPGLCPKCGKRLADGPCGCKDEKEIDPRLEILRKLLEKEE